jgi:hypothetical protein
MKRIASSSALVLALSMSALASAQTPQSGCLHQVPETRPERIRREEALQATRLINNVTSQGTRFGARRYLSWSEIADSGALPGLRSDGGPMGELVRKIRWGTPEPLPGWNIHFVTSGDAYAFSLRDIRDPCGFTYLSDESGVIWEGRPIGQRVGIVPVSPTH